MRGEGLLPDLEDTDPQKTGVAPLQLWPKKPKRNIPQILFNQWVTEARKVLETNRKPTA